LKGGDEIEKEKTKNSDDKIIRKTVRDLPKGRGKGKVISKKGQEFVISRGRIIKISEDTVVLQSVNLPFSGEVRTPLSFGGGTEVLEWEQNNTCKQCDLNSTCHGTCENTRR